jgi:hypothetical protein
VDAIVAGDTTNGAGRPLLEREILDPAAPILKVGGLGDPFQVSDEAEVGIEPTHKGFADPCLTTWLLRHDEGRSLVEAGSGASGSFRGQSAFSIQKPDA